MPRVLIFNKPFGVHCQFTPGTAGPSPAGRAKVGAGTRATLKDFIPVPDVYPAGRLDAESEGLLVLTDDGRLQAAIADPRHKLEKGYWAQVEGSPTEEALRALREGVRLSDGPTLPASARLIEEPAPIWPRTPPIRVRKAIPTAWLELGLREGRNRQVRRMTASVGLPTLRLVRFRVGPWALEGLGPGEWREVRAPAAAELRAPR